VRCVWILQRSASHPHPPKLHFLLNSSEGSPLRWVGNCCVLTRHCQRLRERLATKHRGQPWMWRNRFATSLAHATRLKASSTSAFFITRESFSGSFVFLFCGYHYLVYSLLLLLCFALHLFSHEEEFRDCCRVILLDKTRSREDYWKELGQIVDVCRFFRSR
jgi:hypothetical protein